MKVNFDHSLIPPERIGQHSSSLKNYLDYLRNVVENNNYEAPEASLLLSSDPEPFVVAEQAREKLVNEKLKYILVIGIGGSDLGAKAVYDALQGHYDLLEPERQPKIIWLDAIYNQTLLRLNELLRSGIDTKEELAVCIISESGQTLETIANAEIILDQLTARFGAINDRIAVVTKESSPLYDFASKAEMFVATVPENVGGRFAVLSAVGLVPLSLAGVDIKSLRDGAVSARNNSFSEDLETNVALRGAGTIYEHYNQGRKIYDQFLFRPELESLGKWYRQLLAESVGKGENTKNEKVVVGITPTVSIGSTDLHSVGQLYFSTPGERLMTFVTVPEKSSVTISESDLTKLTPVLVGKSPSIVASTISKSVMETYQKHQMPFSTIELEAVSEYELGQYLQYRMIETMLLGELLDVNTFNQPNVEEYKQIAKQYLTNS